MLSLDNIQTIIAAYFSDKPVKKVWLFGSYARGEAKENSDIDLLIDVDDAPKRLTYFDLARFLGDLEEQLNRRVDLVEEKGLHPLFRKGVLKDRQLIYSA